jgi:outer membrane protein assembly factor BamB
VVGAEIVVVVAGAAVLALDRATGEIRWSASRSEGPAGPAAIAGDLVVHVSGAGVRAALVARRLDDGRERWRAFLGGGARGGLTVADDTVYVGTDHGVLLGFDTASGEERFRFESSGGIPGTPAVADGLVVASWEEGGAGGSTVRAVRIGSGVADRAPEWQVAMDPAPLAAATVAVDGEVVVVAGGDGSLRAVGLESGAERWTARLRDVATGDQIPAAGPALIVADRLHVARVDHGSGEERWNHRLADLHAVGPDEFNTLSRSAPAVVGNAVLIGDASGQLSAVDVATGRRVWRADIGDRPVAPVAADGDRLYAATLGPDGELVALAHDPEGRLLDEVSPTVLFPVRALLNFVVAFVATALVILALFRLGLRRRRPPRPSGGGP